MRKMEFLGKQTIIMILHEVDSGYKVRIISVTNFARWCLALQSRDGCDAQTQNVHIIDTRLKRGYMYQLLQAEVDKAVEHY